MNVVNYFVSLMGILCWLFKCEYWENCGGFLYVLLIVGLILLVMSIVGIVFGLFVLYWVVCDGGLYIDGEDVNINGLDLVLLICDISVKDLVDFGNGFDLILVFSLVWLFLVLVFVVFFYCLGVLYDDCCDCSILFWKLLLLLDI